MGTLSYKSYLDIKHSRIVKAMKRKANYSGNFFKKHRPSPDKKRVSLLEKCYNFSGYLDHVIEGFFKHLTPKDHDKIIQSSSVVGFVEYSTSLKSKYLDIRKADAEKQKHDREKAQLIMQVMNLTQEQINMVPLEQRKLILEVRAQITAQLAQQSKGQ